MKKEDIIEKLKEIKPKYEEEGLIILGIFGSWARDENSYDSDIDILYKLDIDKFVSKNNGFKGFSRILSVKEELSKVLNKEIDLCTINQNNEDFKKYALKDAIYV
jgi:predicted nucleotidyltransferase